MESKWSLLVDDRDNLIVEKGDLTGIRETMDYKGRTIRCSCISVHDSFDAANAAKRTAQLSRNDDND